MIAMKKPIILSVCLTMLLIQENSAQNTVQGVVREAHSKNPLSSVTIILEPTKVSIRTDIHGLFKLVKIPDGNYTLVLHKDGYQQQKYPIELHQSTLNLGDLFLTVKTHSEIKALDFITLSDHDLNSNTSLVENITGLLQASKDSYLRTAAFEFGTSFFKVRGLGSEHGSVLFNGVEVNKVFHGRPQWSEWGGLNQVTKNQDYSSFLSPSNYGFGGLLGTTYINTRPSYQKALTQLSYASSNRSYRHRMMITHASGIGKNGWSYLLSGSIRKGSEGFVDGTSYDGFSVLASIEKEISDRQSISLTALYTPNRRGKGAPVTAEVFDLKGSRYNPYWGYQNGVIRNSRVQVLHAPMVVMNYYNTLNKKSKIQGNVAYQYSALGNSRIEFNGTNLNPSSGFPEGGGVNPDPTYYQKLPSYALRNFPNQPQIAFGLQQEFLRNGQLDWNIVYQTNIDSKNRGENAINLLYEDRIDDQMYFVSGLFNTKLRDDVIFDASLSYKASRSKNYAHVVDLLGGTGFLDVDNFEDDLEDHPEQIQNNVKVPNRIVKEGDTFKYHYSLDSKVIRAFAQTQVIQKRTNAYLAVFGETTQYLREGFYQNGGFLASSFGKGAVQNFMGLGIKSGGSYKLTGRHLFDVNMAYFSKAPTIQNTYANARENHAIVPNITNETLWSIDLGYRIRTPIVQGKITAYYTAIKNANDISFFYAEGIGGETTAFVQEILQNVEKRQIGGEFAMDFQLTTALKLKGVAAIGQFTYANNPNLYLASEDFIEPSSENALLKKFGMRYLGTTKLKNTKLANGPQQAYSIGFEYRDSEYWWFGATTNFFSRAYIDVSPIQRSSNFYTDADGQPFNDYRSDIAGSLLQQERIKGYMVVNMVGGKTWKWGRKYIGVFASVNNLLNTTFKTGGFEQGRNANYRQLLEDKSLDQPVFGNKYWYGRGSTYFININLKY